ncbi:YciI family protein [Hydrotalea sp.]|uniref:YciI family protein n=1 Tax=Hydrotalea sp. TaxID=2881279 RepID=UPI00261BDA7E|nr:YciI family protein [Hydrotalea sp.]
MYIIDIIYKVPTTLIDQHMEAHIAFLEKHYHSGNFIASGKKEPRTGGIILAIAENKKIIEQIMAQDPFYINQLADWNIIEFKPTKSIKAFTALLEGCA